MTGLRGCVAALVLLAAVSGSAAGCSSSEPGPQARSQSPSPTPSVQPDKYVDLADRLHEQGVEVWFEIDLVARWLEGPAAFATALDRVGRLARVPGTVGFKIADELGYGDGLDSPAQATRFLREARRGLARVAPGKQVLVDVVVLDLGCLPWLGPVGRACAADARRAHPAAATSAIEGYLRAGLVDRVDLSTGLLEPAQYAARGLTRDDAQREAWARVVGRGWARMVHLQARKALAAEGGYQGSAEQAGADVTTYVEVPRTAGAAAVDIWTWRQPYSGGTVSLLADGLRPNPLWTALIAARSAGAHLVTHMTPSAMPTTPAGLDAECKRAAEVFDAVFVAAGAG
jgi:hypothetical protein